MNIFIIQWKFLIFAEGWVEKNRLHHSKKKKKRQNDQNDNREEKEIIQKKWDKSQDEKEIGEKIIKHFGGEIIDK